MIACNQSDNQQVIAERKEEERGVENSHQHRAEISEVQQKGENGAYEFDQSGCSIRCGSVGVTEVEKEAAPGLIEAARGRSALARRISYAINSLFAGVFRVAHFVVNRS